MSPDERPLTDETAEWSKAGKQQQQQHIAELKADPRWMAMAQQLGGFPGLARKHRDRGTPNGHGDQKPAHDQAVTNGWLPPEREPGMEG